MQDTKHLSSVPFKRDGLNYEVLGPGDAGQAASCASHAFAVSEPLSRAMRIQPALLAPLAELLCNRVAAGGLSIVAKDRPSGRIIGFSLCDDFTAEPPEALCAVHVKLRPMLAMLRRLEEEYMRNHRTVQGQLLHIAAIGLDPRYARAGVATNLLGRSLDLAQRKGFLGAVAATTGVVSRHILRDKLGFRERFRIEYRSYAYEGVHVFREVDGQSGCSWMEKLF